MAQDLKPKQSQRKINPNNLQGPDDDQKRRPRFNVYWVYGLIFAAIVGYNLFKGVSSAGVETNIESFKEIVKQGDIDEIKIIRNKEIVRVYLNKDSITHKSAFYRSILKGKEYEAVNNSEAPQMYFTIGDDKNFTEQMENFRKENPNYKSYSTKYDKEGELFGQIVSTLLPILLIGLLFIMMMHKLVSQE